MAEMKNLKIEVVRYNPEVDTAPHSAFYEVPYDATTSLLDALGYIKDLSLIHISEPTRP